MKRWIVLGENSTKMYRLTNWMHQKTGLEIINGDEIIEHDNREQAIEALLNNNEWVVRTTYNRALTLMGDEANGVVFVDFPLWKNILDAILHFNFKRVKKAFYYKRVKRPWVLKKLDQFGVEKQVIIIKNRRTMRRFVKNLTVPNLQRALPCGPPFEYPETAHLSPHRAFPQGNGPAHVYLPSTAMCPKPVLRGLRH